MTKKATEKPKVVETVHIFIPRPNLRLLTEKGVTDDPFVCVGSFDYQTQRAELIKGGSMSELGLPKPAATPKIVGSVKKCVRRIRKRGHIVMGAIAHAIQVEGSIFVGLAVCSADEKRFNLADPLARNRAVKRLMQVFENTHNKPGWLYAIQLGLVKVNQADVAAIAEKKIERGRRKDDMLASVNKILGPVVTAAGLGTIDNDPNKVFAEALSCMSDLVDSFKIPPDLLNNKTGG